LAGFGFKSQPCGIVFKVGQQGAPQGFVVDLMSKF
jgi:hypothetical protein